MLNLHRFHRLPVSEALARFPTPASLFASVLRGVRLARAAHVLCAGLALALSAAPSWAQFEFKKRVPELNVFSRAAALDISVVQASPSVLEFGNSLIATPTVLELQWQNLSDTPVTLSAPAITAGSGFALTGNGCTIALAPSQSCTLQVRFIPTSFARHTAVLSLTAQGRTTYVPLAGTGVADPVSAVSWVLPSVTYGDSELALTPPITGLPGAWTFSSQDPNKVEIEGQLALIKGAGLVTLTATQAASPGQPERSYSAMLNVKKAAPELGPWPALSVPVGVSAVLGPAPSQSEGIWGYQVANAQLARVEGNVLRGLATGATLLLATQAEGANHLGVRVNVPLRVLPLAQVELTLSQGLSTRQGESRAVSAALVNRSGLPMQLANQSVTVSSSSGLFSVRDNTCHNTTLAPGAQCTFGLQLSGVDRLSGRPAAAGLKNGQVWVNSGAQAALLAVRGTVTARPSVALPGGSTGAAPEGFAQQCHNRFSPQYGGQVQQYFCNGDTWVSALSQRSACSQCNKFIDNVVLSSASVDFGANQVGSTVQRSVYLTNNESFAVELSGVAVSGATAFSSRTNCATLQPGQSCAASVTFSPSAGGALNGRLQFISSTEGSPYVVRLSGSGAYQDAQRGSLAVASRVFGDPAFTLSPPASNSPGAWSFSSSNPSVARIVGNTVTPLSAGATTITATQAASGPYASGSVSASLVVAKAPATVSDWAPLSWAYQGSAFTLTAPSSNSNGTWSYAWAQNSLGTLVGNQFSPSSAGTATLVATQAPGTNHLGATRSTQVTVLAGAPTLGEWALSSASLAQETLALTPPNSNSPGAWSYTSANPAVATVQGNVVTFKRAGQTVIVATQAATALFTSAQASATLNVNAPVAQPAGAGL